MTELGGRLCGNNASAAAAVVWRHGLKWDEWTAARPNWSQSAGARAACDRARRKCRHFPCGTRRESLRKQISLSGTLLGNSQLLARYWDVDTFTMLMFKWINNNPTYFWVVQTVFCLGPGYCLDAVFLFHPIPSEHCWTCWCYSGFLEVGICLFV